MRDRWKNILRLALMIFCASMIGINIYLANANGLVGNQLPMPFGFGMSVVLSGSMEPELSVGDLLIVKETSNVKKNDVIVFQDGRSLVVHRVIEIDGKELVTKGDANNTADNPIDRSVVKGKVICAIPYVGNVVDFLKTPVGTVLLLIGAVALLEIPRRDEKKKDEEEQNKLVEEIESLKKELYDK